MRRGGGPVAQVVYEDGVVVLDDEHDEIYFGRSEDCHVRFGHLPVVDQHVAGIAGRVFLCDGRLAVENLSVQIAFDIKEADEPLETVRPGAIVSPPGSAFELHYTGSTHRHVVRVRGLAARTPARSAPAGRSVDPTPLLAPGLTDRQWAVLDAYAAPRRAGATVPATHTQVADRLGWSMSLIRLECDAIWRAFLAAGVPMREFPDKRDAIVDAAVRHRLRTPVAAAPAVRREARR